MSEISASIISEFGDFGFVIEESSFIIIEKISLFLVQYDVEISDLVGLYVAYKNNKKNDNDCITLKDLERFEKEILIKNIVNSKAKKKLCDSNDFYTSSLAAEILEIENKESKTVLLNAYNTNGFVQKRLSTDVLHEPNYKRQSREIGTVGTPLHNVTTMNEQDPSTASKPYHKRQGIGDRICALGIVDENREWYLTACAAKENTKNVNIRILSSANTYPLESTRGFMFEKLVDKCHVLDSVLENLSSLALKKLHLKDANVELASPNTVCHEEVWVAGRIVASDNDASKLSFSSCYIESSLENHGAHLVALDLTLMTCGLSLFPGQCLLFRGSNPTGDCFRVTQVCEPPAPEWPLASELSLMEYDGPIHVVAASAPLTLADSLDLQPFADLMRACQQPVHARPHVLLLCGPLVDEQQDVLTRRYDEHVYLELYQQRLLTLLEMCARLRIHLVLIASSRELHKQTVFPQPPVAAPLSTGLPPTLTSWLHLLPDPCMLRIGAHFTLGVCATDVLLHLSSEEISRQPDVTDRLERLCQHLLLQRTFYPLYPSHLDVPLDLTLWKDAAQLHVRPHCLLLPSQLRCFAKRTKDDCVCVNPGRLTRANSAGSYCRLVYQPACQDSPGYIDVDNQGQVIVEVVRL